MYEPGRRFDAWDIVVFVVAAFGGCFTMKALDAPASAGMAFGAGAVALRRALFPKPAVEVLLEGPAQTTGRSLGQAVCLGFGIMLAPLSGLATLALCLGAIFNPALWSIDLFLGSAVIFAGSVQMLRFAFRR